MEMDGHESDLDGSVSNNDEELSDIHDEDSDDHLSRVQEDGNEADILSKLKQQVRNMERNDDHIQNQTPTAPHDNPPPLSPFPHQFPLPLPFPFPHPAAAAAFLPPVSASHVPPYPPPNPHNSSSSSHSSESSNSSQQQTWSFEEQFKQVRQLYEINDDPKRKEFLDDLFSFMQKRGIAMRTPIVKSTREEVRQKLLLLYSTTLDLGRNVLDFDKSYDFFSMDESRVLKYSSNWFTPERYTFQPQPPNAIKTFQTLAQDETIAQKSWPQPKQESLLKPEKSISTNLTRDLEVLGRTPYQIGLDGEKFRVVAATLQKCNSPFVRRTFHFTSNGIVEAPEKKTDLESPVSVIPFLKQAKTVVPPQKFVRIRRFRVIKKNDLPVEKYVLPQKIKITNGEKTRFLTVRIRPKNAAAMSGDGVGSGMKAETAQSETQKLPMRADEGKSNVVETEARTILQAEGVPEAVEQPNANSSEADASSASVETREEDTKGKMQEVGEMKQGESQKEDKSDSVETFNCDHCGKHFPTYLSCLAHIRSHQRQVCQYCSRTFVTVKMLREHIKMQHQQRPTKAGTSEDRITTATSKFGRTRQVLNVAGLRSKYKML